MTTAADTRSDAGTGAPTGRRRVRVDLIGLGAVVIAGLGLAATILVTRTPALESTPAPGVPAVVAPGPPTRDQWYLDIRSSVDPGAPAIGAHPHTGSGMDSTVMRDQWYLDRADATALPVSSQMRDRWYLDGRAASDVPKDRWYADRP